MGLRGTGRCPFQSPDTTLCSPNSLFRHVYTLESKFGRARRRAESRVVWCSGLRSPGLMAGGVVLSGPGEACVDALRCAAFLVRQHPQELKEALDSMNASRSTSREGGEGGGAWWLEGLVGALQSLVGQASGKSRRRRRRKKRRKGQAGEEQEEFEDEEEESTASEHDKDEEEEASGGAWRAGGRGGGQGGRGQQLQQDGAAAQARGRGQPTEQPGSMDVDPAASVSVSVRARADLAITSSRRAGGAVRRAAVAEALSLADVVGSIFSFLVGVGEASTGRQSVRQLGQLGLVCRKWREVSLWEAWWASAAEEVLPAVAWGRGEGGGVGKGRRRVLEHGRMLLCERRVWVGEEDWARGLSVHFEVFDRWDGLQMLSARGPLYADITGDARYLWLGIGPGHRWEVVGRPFSAASRDPEQRRFQSMRDFFERSHDEAFASSICVRVSVTDERTGRRAVLWEEGKRVPREVVAVEEDVQPWVGEEASQVQTFEWQPVACPPYGGPRLQGYVSFVVEPVAGQAEGVSEQERVWQLAGADEQNYDQHGSFIGLLLVDGDVGSKTSPVDQAAVWRFVRSVLGVGQV